MSTRPVVNEPNDREAPKSAAPAPDDAFAVRVRAVSIGLQVGRTPEDIERLSRPGAVILREDFRIAAAQDGTDETGRAHVYRLDISGNGIDPLRLTLGSAPVAVGVVQAVAGGDAQRSLFLQLRSNAVIGAAFVDAFARSNRPALTRETVTDLERLAGSAGDWSGWLRQAKIQRYFLGASIETLVSREDATEFRFPRNMLAAQIATQREAVAAAIQSYLDRPDTGDLRIIIHAGSFDDTGRLGRFVGLVDPLRYPSSLYAGVPDREWLIQRQPAMMVDAYIVTDHSEVVPGEESGTSFRYRTTDMADADAGREVIFHSGIGVPEGTRLSLLDTLPKTIFRADPQTGETIENESRTLDIVLP